MAGGLSTLLIMVVIIDVAIVEVDAQVHANVFLRDIRRSNSTIREERRKSGGNR